MNSVASKTKIVVLCGPTAVGKTATAVALCRALKGEIINADSMQVYRHMDIGTAKPTREEQRMITHHMVDVIDPDQDFDAAKFADAAHDVIARLKTKGILPVVAGGTGLYIKALIHGLFDIMPSDSRVRKQLKSQADKFGSGFLHYKLKAVDPDTAEKLHPNDLVRIIRALEVYELSGRPISQYQKEHGFKDQPYEVIKIGLLMGRDELYRRIDLRVEAMIGGCLLDEVKGLMAEGYGSDLRSMQSLGYRHMGDYLEGRADWQETIRILKRDTRRYAKRQMTWFKKDKDIIWISPYDIEGIIGRVKRFLKLD